MEEPADYGIDSPSIVAGLLLAGAGGLRRVRSVSQSCWLTTLLNFGMVRVFRVTGTKPRSEDSVLPFKEMRKLCPYVISGDGDF